MPKKIKTVFKKILSSDKWPYQALRWALSRILFFLWFLSRVISPSTASSFYIYACIFTFDPDKSADKVNSSIPNLERCTVISARAFFEIAFSRGELPKIYNYLSLITKNFPHLFTPWKLLHYSLCLTKSWQLLAECNQSYELYRGSKLEAERIFGYDVIAGDHITSSIGHSQIFFDFEILKSLHLKSPPRIAILCSERDTMSDFYIELFPELFSGILDENYAQDQISDSVNFIQDSFNFLIAKKYFGYLDERGRTEYLASWAATGAKAYTLTDKQNRDLSSFLKEVGLVSDDWYVVLHVREGADTSIRNADIESYYDAINAITSNGGWVFRIGDATMTPLREGMLRVVDLPFSRLQKPKYLDLYLLASARFVICTCSGPSDFPFYFNIPRLVTNWPFMSALHGGGNDMCLPVSYCRKSSSEIVPLREQLASLSYDNEAKLRMVDSIIPIKNSASQIEQSTIEMIKCTSVNRIRSNFQIPGDDSLFYKYKDKMWFMGSIPKSFLEKNPGYLD